MSTTSYAAYDVQYTMQNKSRTRTHLLLSLSEVCYVKLLDHQVKRTLHLELERNPPLSL